VDVEVGVWHADGYVERRKEPSFGRDRRHPPPVRLQRLTGDAILMVNNRQRGVWYVWPWETMTKTNTSVESG
jgi:hypothetical protein